MRWSSSESRRALLSSHTSTATSGSTPRNAFASVGVSQPRHPPSPPRWPLPPLPRMIAASSSRSAPSVRRARYARDRITQRPRLVATMPRGERANSPCRTSILFRAAICRGRLRERHLLRGATQRAVVIERDQERDMAAPQAPQNCIDTGYHRYNSTVSRDRKVSFCAPPHPLTALHSRIQ